MYYWPERKRNRLENYNYSYDGYYFVTICTRWRINHFWEIIDWEMILNDYGEIASREIMKTENMRHEILFDACVIMPNHFHLIIVVKDTRNLNAVKNGCVINKKNVVGVAGLRPLRQDRDITKNYVSNAIQRIKSSITRNIRQNYGDYEFAWQRSFYDVIIRNDQQLHKTRQYILDNPTKWNEDLNNPQNLTLGT